MSFRWQSLGLKRSRPDELITQKLTKGCLLEKNNQQAEQFSQNQSDWFADGVYFYNLLAKMLQDLPDEETYAWYESLLEEDILSDQIFNGDNADITKGLKLIKSWLYGYQKDSSTGLEKINIDHTRLFLGVGKPLAPPWESVYFDEGGRLFQKETFDVRAWFRKYNLQIDKFHNEPDDHLGFELAFLGYLCARCLSALERDDEAEFQHLMEDQKEFFIQHPAKWIPSWYDRMQQNAQTDFFIGLALLVKGGMSELAAIHDLEFLSD